MVRAPGEVAFTKGGLSGSGVGMTYDKNNDVLTLLAEPDVTMAGTEGSAGTSFKAGAAVLDRLMDVLVLSGGGHAAARRADVRSGHHHGAARPGRGATCGSSSSAATRAWRAAAGALDAMSAQAIDLVYLEGGDTLDRVTLTGNAAAALTGKAGPESAEKAPRKAAAASSWAACWSCSWRRTGRSSTPAAATASGSTCRSPRRRAPAAFRRRPSTPTAHPVRG